MAGLFGNQKAVALLLPGKVSSPHPQSLPRPQLIPSSVRANFAPAASTGMPQPRLFRPSLRASPSVGAEQGDKKALLGALGTFPIPSAPAAGGTPIFLRHRAGCSGERCGALSPFAGLGASGHGCVAGSWCFSLSLRRFCVCLLFLFFFSCFAFFLCFIFHSFSSPLSVPRPVAVYAETGGSPRVRRGSTLGCCSRRACRAGDRKFTLKRDKKKKRRETKLKAAGRAQAPRGAARRGAREKRDGSGPGPGPR